MTDPETPLDPEGFDGVPWNEAFLPPVPDVVDLVLEVSTMMSVFAAQRFVRIDGMRRELLVEAEGRGLGVAEIVERSIRLELAAAMRVTEYTAGRMIAHADALVHRYPAVLDALAGGRITETHAVLLADGIDELTPELREDAAARALILAEAEPVGTFRRALRTLVERVQAATLEERYAAAVQTRRVILEPGVDGMGALHVFAPMVKLHAIHGRVTAIGKTLTGREGEDRTLDQIRADVVCDLLVDGTTDHLPATASGIRASVVVTVPVLTLLDTPDGGGSGAADSGGGTARAGGGGSGGAAAIGDLPVVEGIGPIPVSRARELCGGDGKWMRVLTHPETGIVLSVGRDKYEPPPALRKLVKWRADRCMAPGCGMPASRCDVDHQIAWADGGHTCLENNCPFCKGHHTVKHHGGWHVRQIEDSGGAIEWTSPTGRRYIVHPERRVPVFTMSAHDNDPAPF